LAKKEKAISKMTNKELAEKAEEVGAVITDDMDRKEVEAEVKKAMDASGAGDEPEDEAPAKKGSAIKARNGCMILRNTKQKGVVTFGGKKWSGLVQREVENEEAAELMQRFPGRFTVVDRG